MFERLIICMGGTDPHNLTRRALAAAVSSGMFRTIDVVTRTGQELGNLPANVHQHSSLEAGQMSSLMTQNDIIIAPASSLSFEAISSRICLICGHFEPNQHELYEYLDKNEIAFGAGDFRSLNEEGLQRVIAESIPFFKSQDRSRRLIDGQQDARFKRAFMALTH